MTQEQLSKAVDDFVKKYSGKTVGYPEGSYVGECLSLCKLYIKEVFGFDPPPSGCNGARCYWEKFPSPLSQYFVKIVNDPQAIPQKGDIPVWNSNAGGGYGHISIFLSGDVNIFTSFDANWGGRQAHKVEHNYTNIFGWLRPKLETTAPVPTEPVITNQTLIPQLGNKQVQQIKSELIAKDNEIKNLKSDKVLMKEEYEGEIKDWKLKYEKLLIKKAGDVSIFSLFLARLKDLFKRSEK